MPPYILADRRVATGTDDIIELTAVGTGLHIKAIEIVNLDGSDRVSMYLKATNRSTDQIVILIPETDTSSDGTDYDHAVWSGSIPFEFPMVARANFLKATATDRLWFKMLLGKP